MEKCDRGDFYDHIRKNGPYTEHSAAILMRKLLKTVKYLHLNGIMHRDLKPSNILLASNSSDDEPKIIDFGLAKYIEGTRMSYSMVGSVHFMAPEVYRLSYNYRCDIWSLGCIMHVLLAGAPPFLGKDEEETKEFILNYALDFSDKIWRRVSNDSKDLLKKLLTKNPSNRISIAEALKHPWITNAATLEDEQRSPD
jgi:calcium-dependent protein kinase